MSSAHVSLVKKTSHVAKPNCKRLYNNFQIRSQLKFMVGMPFWVTLFNPLQTHLLLAAGLGL